MPELYFKGKEFVYNHHLTVPYRSMETQPDKSLGEDSGNLIIHGDNLHALKALLLTDMLTRLFLLTDIPLSVTNAFIIVDQPVWCRADGTARVIGNGVEVPS